MNTLKDEDGNIFNITLKIKNGNLYAYNESDREAEPYLIVLNRDNIDVTLR